MRRWAFIALALAAGLGLFFALRPSAPRTPEERIRAALEAAAKAAQERKVNEVVELLSARFQGQGWDERFGRDDARRFIAAELLRGQWVSVAITGVTPLVEGPRARATVHAVLSRSADGSKLPGEASAHRFQLDLEEEEGEWRVVSATWRQIDLSEALSGPPEPDW